MLKHAMTSSEAPAPEGEEEEDTTPTCWICYNVDDITTDPIKCCRCKGSIEFVHPKCLLRWLEVSGKTSCDRCKYEYQVSRDYLRPWMNYLEGGWVEIGLTVILLLVLFWLMNRLVFERVVNHYRLQVYGRMSMYFLLFKFEVVACLSFLLFYVLYKIMSRFRGRGVVFLDLFCSSFEEPWSAFLSGMPDSGIHIVGQDAYPHANFLALFHLMYVTLKQFFRGVKGIVMQRECVLQAYKE